MLLGNVMWEIFQNTGDIEAYLIYRSCNDGNTQQFAAQPGAKSPVVNQTKRGDYVTVLH